MDKDIYDYKEHGILITSLIKILPITRFEILDKFKISEDTLINIENGNVGTLELKGKSLDILFYLRSMRLCVNSTYGAFGISPHMINNKNKD